MPLKKYKPVTPVRRYRQSADFAELTKKPAEKQLTESTQRSVAAVPFSVCGGSRRPSSVRYRIPLRRAW